MPEKRWIINYPDAYTAINAFDIFWKQTITDDRLKLERIYRGYNVWEMYEGNERIRGEILFLATKNGEIEIVMSFRDLLGEIMGESFFFEKAPRPVNGNELIKILESFQDISSPHPIILSFQRPDFEDNQLKAELELLFPNPKALEKTRIRYFEIIKLKRTSPSLTYGQLANHFGVDEQTIKNNIKALRKHNLI